MVIDMELITIIVPIYNVEKYLRRCLNSILNQTYKNLEIILVDDGSPDNCGKICDEYKTKDSRIKVIHKENGGLSSARNSGLDVATGKYISFIDSDDFVSDKYIEKLYDSLRKSKSLLAMCNYLSFDEDTYDKVLKVKNSDNFEVKLLTKIEAQKKLYSVESTTYVVSWAKLYDKSLFNNIRFPEGKINEDCFITYLIFEKANIITFMDIPLYFYYQNPKSIMGSSFSKNRLDSIEAYSLQCEFYLKQNEIELYRMSACTRLNILSQYYNLASKGLKRKIKNMAKVYYSEIKSFANYENCSSYFCFFHPYKYKIYRLFVNVKGNGIKNTIIKFIDNLKK